MEHKENASNDSALNTLSEMSEEELFRLVKRSKGLEREKRSAFIRKQNQDRMEEFVPDLLSGGPDQDMRVISLTLAEDKLSIFEFSHGLGGETIHMAYWVPSMLGTEYTPTLFSGFDFERAQFLEFAQVLQNLSSK